MDLQPTIKFVPGKVTLVAGDTSNPFLEIARGNVTGQSAVHKFGHNPSVANNATEAVTYSGAINFLQAATTVRVKAGDAADNSGQVGAITVTVEGLDSNWAAASETLSTNGTSAGSAGSTSFIRVFRAYVATVGTYAGVGSTTGANVGDLTIENSAGGTDLITIKAGRGQSETSAYTVPAGKTAYMTRFTIEIDASKPGDMRMYQRRNADDVTTPFSPRRLVHAAHLVQGVKSETLQAYIPFPAKTDLWWEITAGSNGTSGAVDYDLILVND